MKKIYLILTSFVFAIAVGCGSNSSNEQPASDSVEKLVVDNSTGDEEFDAMLRELDSMGAQQDTISYVDVSEEEIHAMFEKEKSKKQ